MQDTFIKVHKSYPKFKGDSEEKTWMRTCYICIIQRIKRGLILMKKCYIFIT